MLRKVLLMAILVGFFVLPHVGCFTFDMAHNREHIQVWVDDMRYIHEDLDFIFGLRRRSFLHTWVD